MGKPGIILFGEGMGWAQGDTFRNVGVSGGGLSGQALIFPTEITSYGY